MNVLRKELEKAAARCMADETQKVCSDKYRQGFHLMPPIGWMNDPNGLCYFKGRYHVYYQYAPLDAEGGLKFWGHKSSRDLLNWIQEPIFLYPDETYDVHGVYSGCALVDEDEVYFYYTGNVKHDGEFDYTASGREQNTILCISRDARETGYKQVLLTNADYPKDMSCHVRDPKVFRDGDSYYMIIGARDRSNHGCALIYHSEDKVNWTYCNTIKTTHEFGYMWECPEILKIDSQYILALSPQGLTHEKYANQNQYSCGYFPLYGDFKGECTLGEFVEFDYGFDYYAQQSFIDPKGRTLALGWMGMPDASYDNRDTVQNGWQHCMTVFRKLEWKNNQIYALPAEEYEALRRNKVSAQVSKEEMYTTKISSQADIEINLLSDSLELDLEQEMKLEIQGKEARISLNAECGRGRDIRRVCMSDIKKIRILKDNSSLEFFFNDGEKTMTTRYYPKQENMLRLIGDLRLVWYELGGDSLSM